MGFPRSKILSTERLAQMIRESNENGQRFCFILGSGASVESGIPTGNTLEMRWMNCLMGEQEDQGTPAMDAAETQKIAEALEAEKGIEHKFDSIIKAWQRAKKQGSALPSKYYFDIYKLRFHASPRNGYSYMEKIMERCEPSLGYHTLTMLLTKSNLNNLVITTNFDSLVEDALFLYSDKKPLVVSHESLADYIEANIQRPIIAKVHRGLLYAPFNSPETTNKLKDEWRRALGYAFSNYTPVVIGYGGGDHSLMAFMREKATVMRNGIYWCYLGKTDDVSALPDANIQKLIQEKDGYMVAIDGFDALMVEIGKVLYEDAIIPSETEKHLREKNDKRIRRYNEQWDALNEKPEMKESLQELNEAEQMEEEKREGKKELTAWDYIRRGIRAKEEKRFEDAIKEYQKAIEKDPQNVAAYNNLGNVYFDLGQYERAMEEYRKAMELNPDYAKVYNNRGVVYENMGLYEEALKDYTKAIELAPDYARAYSNRGDIYMRLNQYEMALGEYSKVIELDPKDKDAYIDRARVYRAIGETALAEKDKETAEKL